MPWSTLCRADWVRKIQSLPRAASCYATRPSFFGSRERRTRSISSRLERSWLCRGRNIVIEYRWAENQYDRLPALGAGSSSPSGGGDPARWKCGVTCCEAGDHHNSDRVLWQRRPGRRSPLNRPGGNVTGVVTLNIDTGQKGLELGSTTARSGDEVALIADTISHYPPVLSHLCQSIRRAGVQKKFGGRAGQGSTKSRNRRAGAERPSTIAGSKSAWLVTRYRAFPLAVAGLSFAPYSPTA